MGLSSVRQDSSLRPAPCQCKLMQTRRHHSGHPAFSAIAKAFRHLVVTATGHRSSEPRVGGSNPSGRTRADVRLATTQPLSRQFVASASRDGPKRWGRRLTPSSRPLFLAVSVQSDANCDATRRICGHHIGHLYGHRLLSVITEVLQDPRLRRPPKRGLRSLVDRALPPRNRRRVGDWLLSSPWMALPPSPLLRDTPEPTELCRDPPSGAKIRRRRPGANHFGPAWSGAGCRNASTIATYACFR
jgi:hypothetical protein